MKLYKVSQSINNDYDTYDSFVVCAESAEIARDTDPLTGKIINWNESQYYWCGSREHVTVELIGTAKRGLTGGIICASFHAG